MVNLSAKPFFLNEEEIKWVMNTKASMSLKDKIGQLFLLCGIEGTQEEVERIYSIMNPAGVMFRAMPLKQIVSYHSKLMEKAKIPLLIAANLEKGGNGIAKEGTLLTAPMGIGATDDDEFGRRLGKICGREGAAVGANWAFAPIIDIDTNFRNPITNTRTFGSDPKIVKKMGVAYVEEVQKCGVAASIKHFPGDGQDERDQHLVTSINSMSCEEWDATYGMVYKACIDAGALTVMAGQIMQPAWSKRLNPELKDEDILPASLSDELLNGLLREHLGFNGLITTDASTMGGFCITMPRSRAVPSAIAAGCDLFLFTRNSEEDYKYMMNGYENGIITEKRLDDAITRILGLKAALKLYKKQPAVTSEHAMSVLGCDEHKQWAKEAADKSITLVKAQSGVLPISPEKTKRILFYSIEAKAGDAYSVKAGVCAKFGEMLKAEGFEVTEFEVDPNREGKMRTYKSFEDQYDLIVYVANIATRSNQTAVRIEWKEPMGADVPIYLDSIPTIFISVENPYHLLDVPRVKNFINTYSSTDEVLDSLMDKLRGRGEFKGKSPVDAFCGKWDTHL